MNQPRSIQTVWLFLLFVFVANIAVTQTHGWARFATGVGMYAVLAGVVWVSGLRLADLGLSRKRLHAGVMVGLRVSMVVAAGLLLGLFVSPDTFRDERYHNGIWLATAFALFVVPLQTVLFEELVFRGVIWGFVRKKKGAPAATIVSSALFGLWHIAPSLSINAAATSVGGIGFPRGLIIAGIVAVTYVAGMALCELRRRSDSLLAPILVHWTINGFAAILAAIAWGHIS